MNSWSRPAHLNILKTISLKHAFWWYLKRFLTAEKILKTTSLKHAFRRYLKLFEIAETLLKAMSLKHPFWWYLKRFWTAENFMENNVFKACAINVIETEIWTFYFPPFVMKCRPGENILFATRIAWITWTFETYIVDSCHHHRRRSGFFSINILHNERKWLKLICTLNSPVSKNSWTENIVSGNNTIDWYWLLNRIN